MKPILSRPRVLVRLTILICFFALTAKFSHAQSVHVWESDFNGNKKLEKQDSTTFTPSDFSSDIIITIDPSITHQTMDGFGAAMTGSSAHLINNVLSSSQRDSLMDDLFTSKGIKLDFVRHTVGASDFNLSSYTYNDLSAGETDRDLSEFSISKDQTNIIPMLKLAKQKNPDLKIMGSPWSAPAWMKEVHALNGGWLDVTWYRTYAQYLVKYVQAFENEGLPIYAVTLQNEPLHETSDYPSMRMDAGNQINFLKNDIGPAFANANLNTELIIYDHNWDEPEYPIQVLDDADARKYTAGTAFHAYAGDVNAQTTVHNAHPDKGIWFTEISGGGWATNYGTNLGYYMQNIIIGATRNWAKGSLFWNMALNQNSGPQNGGCTNCRGVVTINTTDGSVTKNEEYYALGHVSKFVDSGAARIESNNDSDIINVAFKNPDGSIVLVVYNQSSKFGNTDFEVRVGDNSFTHSLFRYTTATFKWYPETASSVTDSKFEPLNYSLHNNYPNPFNPSTTIAYTLEKSSNVTIEVTNLMGQKVASLVNQKQPKGRHSVVFDAGHLSSGIFIYRIKAGSFIQTKKMILLK
jgi:glucosylceramidase